MNYIAKASYQVSCFVAKFTNLAPLIYANIYSFERGN